MKAVILAGGLGTRLQPYTMFVPKPMLPLGDKPLLDHTIRWVKKNGIKSFILCTSYLHRVIEDYFEDGARFGVDIEYSTVDKPLATAGQLKTAENLIDDTFVCMYGDSIFDFSLRNMALRHKKSKAFVTMGLYEYETKLAYGVIETTVGGRVKKWNEKPAIKANINMGCYMMEPDIFEYIPKERSYGMDDVIKKVISSRKKVNSFTIKKGFTDIGDKDSYRQANQMFVKKLGKI
ncbi:MAG: nucleoside-diphosphate-sugar pyrophosphorylase [Cenarchaeum symbiont of Oopsacas minuta]|nr:nucleoside-diphosphate-sugar pyrophosphorylase [Cenarchaeum symbiont of Oopsacas minuta]